MILLTAFFAASGAAAQESGEIGADQTPRVRPELIPPAPPLSPEQSLRTFKLPPGFRIELIASEPIIQAPVALQFDPDGRIWVLEMRGFMPNADGIGEDKPVGRVSVLEDSDGDGRADKAKVFLDGLVMPRAFLLVSGGLLVAEPPGLWFYPAATDGPGQRLLVEPDYATAADPRLGAKANPEHAANSLCLAMDNWIYSLDHTWRYRYRQGQWLREPAAKRVQWGQSQDDFGRLFYTSNSDHLRGDLVPCHYAGGVPVEQKLAGVNARIAEDQTVWPIRVNPGVNRGYEPGALREDGRLTKFTAACGTLIYRGDALPGDCLGNAFVCEPAAHLVRRNVLKEENGIVTAQNAYREAEFLASTDELFRPVNLYTGPDGAIYVVDMYHGIIQHRLFLTAYLRRQAEERGLDKVTDRGRIYRIVHGTRPPGKRPALSKAGTAELTQQLSHPNGWWRDTAQRLLIERGDRSAVAALHKLTLGATNALTRLQALWTLEGLAPQDLPWGALSDAQAKVRAAAVRLAEPFLAGPAPTSADLRKKVSALAEDPSADVQIQVALTLGQERNDESIEILRRLSQSPFALVADAARFSLSKRAPAQEAEKPAQGRPLTDEEQKRFDLGKSVYEIACLACHQPHGQGQEGLAPPLAGSEWVAGSAQRLIRLLLHGLRGPIMVKGRPYELDMPSLGVLDDDQIAGTLTYIRREWGHQYDPVDPRTVKQVREATTERVDAWTAEELKDLK